MAAETGWFRGEGGSIIPMDLPLPEAIEARVQAGRIQRVNEDGTSWVEQEPEPDPDLAEAEPESDDLPERPTTSASKAEWVAYAESKGMARDEADGMTKAQLVERFG